MTDNNDHDKVKQLKNNGNQQPDLLANAKSAIEKARRESYEAKIKAKVLVQQEQAKALRITDEEIKGLVSDYESGF